MVVYKYRSGNNQTFQRDVNALKSNYFWGSSIDNLNDPCEALINSDKFTKQSVSLQMLMGERVKDNFIKVRDALENVLNAHKKIGVFSLSEKYNDELLWAHYANSHHGFCVEYDVELLKSGYGSKVFSFPVKYSTKPPDLDFRDINPSTLRLIQKMVGYKSSRWAYEKEYRIITNFYGEFFYPPNAVTAIYFGIRMGDEKKEKLIETLSTRGIRFYQIVQKEKTYKFERKLLKNVNYEGNTYLQQYKFKDKNIDVEFIETKFAELIKRGDIKLKINNLIDKSEILEFSKYLRKNLFFKSDTVLINIYQQGQNVNDINWANSFFRNDNWEININDFALKT